MLGFLASAWSVAQKLIGRPFRDWARWAEAEPAQAAQQLELVSRVLRHRADAYKRQKGWRARRDRKVAAALLEQAQELRASAGREDALRAVCSVRPGEWKA